MRDTSCKLKDKMLSFSERVRAKLTDNDFGKYSSSV